MMDAPGRHWVRVAILFITLEAFLFLYPPAIEAVVPNYFIHMEIWIPLGVVANVALGWWAFTRRPKRPASSTES